MNYYGNIFVDTDIHFDQGFLDPDNKYTEVGASQPYYYFSTKKRTVKFKFLGDKCPIESTIDPEKCYHGYTPPTTPDDPYPGVSSLRIMAEDLSASEASDFDFNDVVFDVVWKSDSEAEIILQAAGGTLPLTVNGVEVHGAFEVETNVMVNTNWTGTNTAKHAPVSLGTVSGDLRMAGQQRALPPWYRLCAS